MRKAGVIIFLLLMSVFFGLYAEAQGLQGLSNRVQSAGSSMGNSGGGRKSDSLVVPQKREKIFLRMYYRKLDDVVDKHLDTSINDFTRFLPLPADYLYLGNLGTAAYPLIYKPRQYTGFDAGFHAFDIYRFEVDSTKFFNSTSPYTRLRYLVGPNKEQLIDVFLTENFSPNLNVGLDFRKINEPGTFRNQTTDDNNLNLFGHLRSDNLRYNIYVSFVSNKLNSGESGGIVADSLLEDERFSNRRVVPVNLGGPNTTSVGFFSTPLATHSNYNESSWLLRQHYDWGTKDTTEINDTTFRYDYLPVFRIEHTLKNRHLTTGFKDSVANTAPDFYKENYNLDANTFNRITARHEWNIFSNDLSIVQFPNKTNQGHFLKLGATFENIKGNFTENSIEFNDVKGHGEYHNLTKNEKWELGAKGEFVMAGRDAGNYYARGSLNRYLNEKLGDIELSFTNINQTPSFIYRFFQSSKFISTNPDIKNTNITQAQFLARNKRLKFRLEGNYFLLNNYTYFEDYLTPAQQRSPFNLLQVKFYKEFEFSHFHWYVNAALQQTTGSNPLQVPLFWTRNRFSYENILFQNLDLNAGIEAKYHTPFHTPNYSPVLQQFVYQGDMTLNPLPVVDAFIHFRIKAFIAYVRAENLTTFLKNNVIEIPHYPYPGFGVRIGIEWVMLK